MDIKYNEEANGTNSVFITIDNFLSPTDIETYDRMIRNIDDWEEGTFNGRQINRMQNWYHDDFKYFSDNWMNKNHKRWMAKKSFDWLNSMRSTVQTKLYDIFSDESIKNKLKGCNCPKLNSTLLNYYRDGGDNIRYHTDDEKIFGDNPTVCMLTFGAMRPLNFKRINIAEKSLDESFVIKPGTLFFMMGSTQKYYNHGIDKDTGVIESRYSVTFREHSRLNV